MVASGQYYIRRKCNANILNLREFSTLFCETPTGSLDNFIASDDEEGESGGDRYEDGEEEEEAGDPVLAALRRLRDRLGCAMTQDYVMSSHDRMIERLHRLWTAAAPGLVDSSCSHVTETCY